MFIFAGAEGRQVVREITRFLNRVAGDAPMRLPRFADPARRLLLKIVANSSEQYFHVNTLSEGVFKRASGRIH